MQTDRSTQPITHNTNRTDLNDFHKSVSDIGSQDPIKKLPTVKERLISAEGGYYLSGEAAKLLGITEPQLEQLRQTDKIIGLPVKDGRHVYPKWQLTKRFWNYRVLPGLAEVLAVFPDDSPWMRAAFMLNDSDCVEFPTPLAGLKAGKLAQVLALSQRFGEHGAA
jgi:hypothetical protein